MSFLRAFLVKRLSTPVLDEQYPNWHLEYSTSQLWRWYEQLQED